MKDKHWPIVTKLSDEQKALEHRAKLADLRAEKLGARGHSYEEETTPDPTPEEEQTLNRIIDLANRASDQHERLRDRARLLLQSITSIEESDRQAEQVQWKLARRRKAGAAK